MNSLSTCGRCGRIIERTTAVSGWRHIGAQPPGTRFHLPEPDDSHVSGPSPDEHDDDCACDGCEVSRALADDEDMSRGMLDD